MTDVSRYSQTTAMRITHLTANHNNLICDGDTHISDPATTPPATAQRMQEDPNYFHGRPISVSDLLWEMDAAGVDVSLSWQNPAATTYTGHEHTDYDALWAANQYVAESAADHPDRVIAAGWTDPRATGLEAAVDLARACVRELRFPIVKMNPAQNEYPIDSETVTRVTEAIIEEGAIPAFHFGADTEFTPGEGFERLARHIAPHRIIGVHMGGGGASYVGAESLYIQAREIGLRNPNVFYIFSAKRDTHMESDLITYQAAGEPFCRNIACGSDAPYGRQTFNYGGFRNMLQSLRDGKNHPDPRVRNNPDLFSDDAISAYLGGNLVGLVLNAYAQIGEG
jgi:predicted TIM-barrel fold metal-dependent hydrolase